MKETKSCKCGSGLPFGRCHGDPRNDFAREQALREAEAIPWLFPFVRAESPDLEALAADVAGDVADEDDVPQGVLDAGLACLSAAERRRIVSVWDRRYPERWRSLVHAAADAAAAERSLAVGIVHVAIAEQQPPARDAVEPLEKGILDGSPLAALSTVITAQFVWSNGEARVARIAAGARPLRKRFDAVEEVAYALVDADHVRRTRLLAARVARALPLAGLPMASGFLAGVCADVERRYAAAEGVAAALLIRYSEEMAAAERAASG